MEGNHIGILERFKKKSIKIPAPEPLPGRQTVIPYFMVADETFPLKDYIMSSGGIPNEKRIFNYRMNRARINDAFGISSRLQLLKKHLILNLTK